MEWRAGWMTHVQRILVQGPAQSLRQL
eukprot:COSAG01_NODE_66454_length_270_cov_0.602339_1_plen_26_part_10